MQAYKDYLDSVLQQHIRITAVAENEARKMTKFLEKTYRDLIKRLGSAKTNFQRARIESMLLELQSLLGPGFQKIQTRMLKNGLDFTRRVIQSEKGLLANVDILSSAPLNVNAIYTAALNTSYQGTIFNNWIGTLGTRTAGKIANIVGMAFVEGRDPIDQLRNVLNLSERNLKTVSRSFYQHVATETRKRVFTSVKEELKYLQWVATLDHRTTTICAARDQRLYTPDYEPVNHTLEWGFGPGNIHWNCRSTFVGIPHGMDITTPPRPAVGAGPGYQKGDNVTRTGRVRKPRRGDDKLEVTETHSRYAEWLVRQPKDFIDDVLGIERSAVFRAVGTAGGRTRLLSGFAVKDGTQLSKETTKGFKLPKKTGGSGGSDEGSTTAITSTPPPGPVFKSESVPSVSLVPTGVAPPTWASEAFGDNIPIAFKDSLIDRPRFSTTGDHVTLAHAYYDKKSHTIVIQKYVDPKEYDAIMRHEFGHSLDNRNVKSQGVWSHENFKFTWMNDYNAKWFGRVEPTYTEKQSWLAENFRIATLPWVDDFRASNFTSVADFISTRMTKKQFELFHLLATDEMSIVSKIRIAKAITTGDAPLLLEGMAGIQKHKRHFMAINDIFAAITKNKIGYGHATEYWEKYQYLRKEEIFANFSDLYGANPKYLDLLEQFIPEFVNAWRAAWT